MRVISLALLALCSTSLFAVEGAQPAAKQQVVQQPLHRHPTLLGMLRRNNEIRRGVGLWPHRMNPALTKAAQDHANYMARSGDFQHYSNGGPQGRALALRLSWRRAGKHRLESTGNKRCFRGLDQQRARITPRSLSSTTDAGFGYAVGANGSTYWVGVYANPAQGDEVGEVEGTAEAEAAKAKKEADVLKAVQEGEDFENAEAAKEEAKSDDKSAA